MAWLSVSYNGSPPIQKMVSSTGSPPRQNASFNGSPPRQNASYHTSPPVQSYSYSGAFPFQSFNTYGSSPLQTFSYKGHISKEKPYSSPKPIRMVIRSGHDGSPIATSPEKVSFRMKKPENLAGEASSGAKPPAAPRSPKRRRRPKKGKGLWAGGRPCPEPMIAPAALPEWPAIADVRSKLKKLPAGKKELDCRQGSKRPDYGS